MTLTALPRLYTVPPAGRSVLAERAAARRADRGPRQVRALPAHDAETPGRAGFTCGIALGVWGVPGEQAEQLAQVAGELTAYVVREVRCERVIVVTAYRHGCATISVIALHGRARRALDPGQLPYVRAAATETGVIPNSAMGPCVYARTWAMHS
ncbi:hypothetical protein [Streptomyces virginiae]|uniref:hypothetical protein n=1 Tax=Streptomyces virginiae TaxID=1961 RepID=UPI0036CDDA7C